MSGGSSSSVLGSVEGCAAVCGGGGGIAELWGSGSGLCCGGAAAGEIGDGAVVGKRAGL